ncbi:hypothetical protein [Sandaracinobacteroides saxicola]|uniref:Uncharacterized protein n=1 Tax=Sandaracinobacteroides saxicola TaxID=2759707 RepID=A0A7G5IDS2_9SPHN|nr:hypothetical protein [Sandaracinobacteroides saxicola]QMW21514.1 hypothetical protein H3309_08745 [Sandaracinobacteroides saxicola]
MAIADNLISQISESFLKIESSPHFSGDTIWLTFYLAGLPEQLKHVAAMLIAEGWVNADGWDSGWIYPKIKVKKSVDLITSFSQVISSRWPNDIIVYGIDADTLSDMHNSKFITLYNFTD